MIFDDDSNQDPAQARQQRLAAMLGILSGNEGLSNFGKSFIGSQDEQQKQLQDAIAQNLHLGQLDQSQQQHSATLAEAVREHNMVDQRDRDLLQERLQAKQDAKDAAVNPLDDATLKMAVPMVMADRRNMYQFAGYGPAGQPAKDQINQAIAQRLSEAGMTGDDLNASRSRFHAQQLSMNQMIPQLNNINSFEGLAKYNGDRLLQLIDGVDTTGIPALEGAIRHAKALGGSVDTNEFNSVLNSFQTEAARIINNPDMKGVLPVSAVNDLQSVIGGNLDAPSMRRIINRLYSEFDTRKGLIQQNLAATQQGMAQPGGQLPGAGTNAIPSGPGAGLGASQGSPQGTGTAAMPFNNPAAATTITPPGSGVRTYNPATGSFN
jgi:hypothetical protein